MTLYALDGIEPSLPESGNCWIADSAELIGKVILADWVSIWFGSVLRGDNEPITIGKGSNIQDCCVLHTDMGFPLTIGTNCTVGHKALLHGCIIEDGVLIGMGATILNGATIGRNSVIGAGSLVPEGKTIPENSLFIGTPARLVRTISDDEHKEFMKAALHYQENITRYRNGLTSMG